MTERELARQEATEALEHALTLSDTFSQRSDWINYLIETVEDIYWEAGFQEGWDEARGQAGLR